MANEIFENQSLTLTLDTNETLTDSEINTALIKYRNKDHRDDSGSLAATVNDGNTTIYANISADTLKPGNYIFWAHITYTDGSVAIGKPVQKRVNAEGYYPATS